jgi:hypothetical protein
MATSAWLLMTIRENVGYGAKEASSWMAMQIFPANPTNGELLAWLDSQYPGLAFLVDRHPAAWAPNMGGMSSVRITDLSVYAPGFRVTRHY